MNLKKLNEMLNLVMTDKDASIKVTRLSQDGVSIDSESEELTGGKAARALIELFMLTEDDEPVLSGPKHAEEVSLRNNQENNNMGKDYKTNDTGNTLESEYIREMECLRRLNILQSVLGTCKKTHPESVPTVLALSEKFVEGGSDLLFEFIEELNHETNDDNDDKGVVTRH